MTFEKKKKKISGKTLLFYVAFLFWPILQFSVFYIAVNLNSFLLAFKKVDTNGVFIEWTVDHFTHWFAEGLDHNSLMSAFGVSFKAYFIHLFIGMPMGLLFSYYIAKKLPGSMFFRVMLYLPSILSALVLVLIYSYFITAPLKDILRTLFKVDNYSKYVYDDNKWMRMNVTVSFPVLMFYNLFVGFGVSVLLYSNKISSISPDLLEAAELDGVNTFQEFTRIIMPHVYPTLSVFLITGIAGIFTNQYNAYPLTGGVPDTQSTTVGYLIYDNVRDAKANIADRRIAQTAALGLMLTVIVIPATFLVRYLLLKFGPSED